MTKGENVVLFIYESGVWVGYACARSITFNALTDFIEISSSGTGKYTAILPTKNSFSATIDGIVSFLVEDNLTYPDLVAKQLAHELLYLRFQHTDNSGDVYTAECNMYISSSTDIGSYDGMNLFTIDLRGTGIITQIFTAQPPIPADAVQVKRFEYTATGGETGFTESTLINKAILEVNKDGIGFSRIITSGTPIAKEVRYTSGTGHFLFPMAYEAGEEIYVLYQDI